MKNIAGIDIKLEKNLNFDDALWLCTEIDKLAKKQNVSVATSRITPVRKQIQIGIDCKNTTMCKDEAGWLWDKVVSLLKSRELAGTVSILE